MPAEEKTKTPGKETGKGAFKNANRKHGGSKSPSSVTSLNSDTAVPMLRLGITNNYDASRRRCP